LEKKISLKHLGGTNDIKFPVGGEVSKDLIPPEMKELKIKKNHSVEYAVKKGQTLHVEFLSDRDIQFGLYVKVANTGDAKKDRVEVNKYKLAKISEEHTPFHCHVTAADDTTYVAYFDNSGNLMDRDIRLLHYIQDPYVLKDNEEKK